ncbi:proprotein convertase P-domain-containing protein [Streptomyces sp. NPDC102360]|uniref:proprotein convertase P-domain-containing protein n=1 Tax=Streptomyces sp. NPDC102360 TaxID=3366160 RepID=UPI00381C2D7C
MKRPIWTTVVIAMTTAALGALPAQAHATAPEDTTTAASGPVAPSLYAATSGGDKVRVNVITENRAELSGVAKSGETVQSFTHLPMVTLKVDRAGLDALTVKAGVVSVTEDKPVPPSLDQSVPLIGGDAAIKAGFTGKGSAIAVLDTGVATHHPFLKGRVTAEACFSPTDPDYGSTSLCPNGAEEQVGVGAADSESGPCASLTSCDHGTHVAGIAAGDGTGVAGAPASGVAPGASLVAVQVFSRFDNDAYCGSGASPCVLSFTSAQVAGLEKVWALKQAGTPIVAANLSLGGGSHTASCDTDARKPVIDSLLGAGVATVAAAGNNGLEGVSSPACVASAIAVGSITDEDELSDFTNRGPMLDLLAPGTDIVSSVPGGGYASKDGTSMAAPHVAGALAVLRQAYPTKSLDSLESLLKATGKPIAYEEATTARVDVRAAIADAVRVPADKPRPTKIINDTDHAVPDTGTVQSPITVTSTPGNAPKALQVSVNVTHDWLGEVKIDLVAPNGNTYALKATNGTDPGGTLNKTYTVDAAASPANGTWKLQVQDKSTGGTGTLNSWSMTFPSPFVKSGAAAVPDAGTLSSAIAVDGMSGNASGTLQVSVNVTHDWLGEVKIDLVAPNGNTYALKATNGTDPGGTLNKTYTVDAAASPANGTWKLQVQDKSTGGTGTLNSWSMTFPSLHNQTTYAVPDAGSVQSPITVTGVSGNASKALRVSVDATHDWLGEVRLVLAAPNGNTYVLKPTNGTDPGGTLNKTYTVDAAASPANGTWKLQVEDTSTGGTGTLDGWALTF